MPSSVHKQKDSKFYQAEIWIDGRRFSRTTRRTTEREAKTEANRIEKELKEKLGQQGAADDSLEINHVADRYMRHVGDHHAGRDNTERLVELLVKYFGKTKDLRDITHQDALDLREWRRAQTVGKKKPVSISAYTVNDTIEQLKKLFTYLKAGKKKLKLPDEPTWPELWLPEPKKRARELLGDEPDRLDDSIMELREDYWPLFEFARATGKRKMNCVDLEWPQVKWDQGVIKMTGKGGKEIELAITPSIRAVLWPLRGHHPERVFTFAAKRTTDKLIRGKRFKFVKGERYPITREGLKRVWNNVRKDVGLLGENRFRWHDFRHDFASKLLRSIPTADGVKVVQMALDHADISTTLNTYSHILDGDTAKGIELLAEQRRQRRNKNHRRKHRSGHLKTA
jgi:integrase